MGRFAHSWELTKASYAVVKQDKELLWMPVLSFLASAVAILGVTGIGFAGHIIPQVSTDQGLRPVAFLLTFALYVLLAFVALFFNAAVVAAATERFKGGNPTVGSALRAAWGKAGKIFLWALVVGTVNLILQLLREMASRNRDVVGRILAEILIAIGAAAWNLATAFMVPVLLFEDKGIGGSLKSSVGIVKRHWGETVIGNAGLGLVSMVAMILVVVLGFFLVQALVPLGLVAVLIGVLVVIAALALIGSFFSVLNGVYRAALYRFATTGQTAPGFETSQLATAFKATQPQA